MSLVALVVASLVLCSTEPLPDALGRAIEAQESTNNTWAVSGRGARGLWQVMPISAKVPVVLLHVPFIGRAEGRRVFRWWLRRCQKRRQGVRCALRVYACGDKGFKRGVCEWYANEVFARMPATRSRR